MWKVYDDNDFSNLIPVVGFYTPVPRGEHQDPSLLPCWALASRNVVRRRERRRKQ
jgi:hypothetical protein